MGRDRDEQDAGDAITHHYFVTCLSITKSQLITQAHGIQGSNLIPVPHHGVDCLIVFGRSWHSQ